MNQLNLGTKDLVVNDKISVHVPTVAEIRDYGQDEYYYIARILTSVPFDMMVQLDDLGIDFEAIDEYDLFLFMLQGFIAQGTDLSIFLGHYDFSNMRLVENKETKEILAVNERDECVIDRLIYLEISDALRRIHFWEKTLDKPGNKAAKEYLIKRNRKKQERARKKIKDTDLSYLDDLIVRLTNTEEFKYNYEQCEALSIYRFNASAKQIIRKKNWDKLMIGVYAGTVDTKKVDIVKPHWMS